jgi:hypothetical protein
MDCLQLGKMAKNGQKMNADRLTFFVDRIVKKSLRRRKLCNSGSASSRAARWHIFKQKSPNWGKFWAVLHDRWYVLWSFGRFYGYLVYFDSYLVNFMVIWYILWSFGIFYGNLVYFMVIWYIL